MGNEVGFDQIDRVLVEMRNVVYQCYDFNCFSQEQPEEDDEEELNDRDTSSQAEVAFDQMRSLDGIA